jgi:3-oxoacyl-[acyl-carrier protein] reductase
MSEYSLPKGFLRTRKKISLMKKKPVKTGRCSSPRVALITGASRGLGERIAVTLARSGYHIAVNYLRSDREADETARRAGGRSLPVKADVGDLKQVGEMIAILEDRFGRLDAVIHNAGITRDNLLVRQSEREWDAVLRTNLKGCFNVIRTAAPLMIKSGGGHIITISSYSGVRGKAGQSAYSASKAALIGLTFTAARELSVYDIKVNAILPGYLPAGMGREAFAAMEEAREKSILKKLASPEEAAEFVVTLLKTEHITGQVFSLDSRVM